MQNLFQISKIFNLLNFNNLNIFLLFLHNRIFSGFFCDIYRFHVSSQGSMITLATQRLQ